MLQDQVERPTQVEVVPVYEGAVWSVTRETFAYRGDRLVRDVMRHPGSVAILAIDQDDRVALIDQYRHPVAERLWEIPGGLLDVPGEAILSAGQRELHEEVDLAARVWEPLIDFYNSPGGSDEHIHIYRATGLTRLPAFAREHEEADMGLTWAPFPEVSAAVFAGALHSPSLVAAVLAEYARRHGAPALGAESADR